jgi:uncharacterized phage protein gp47/JayE
MDFLTVLKNSGIPSTQADLETVWKQTVLDQGSTLSNENQMSPFWRVVTALITHPTLWMINFIAVTVMPNIYVSYATGEFLDLLAEAVNLTRKPAAKAEGKVIFTRANTNANITIPKDTVIQTVSIAGFFYQLVTTQAKSFATNQLTASVPVIAVDVGEAYNLATNFYSVLPVAIAGIESVTNSEDWLISPGADIETDDALRSRVKNQFGTVGQWHTDSVYRSMIASFIGVDADAIYFEHNAPRGPGTANAWILFDFNVNATNYLTSINNYINTQGNHGHGDDLVCYQMPTQDITLSVDVWHNPFLSNSEIDDLESSVRDFINAAFRKNKSYAATLTYPYNRFSFSKLGEELHLAFSNIRSIDFNETDIVTEKWIPKLTTLTVTMHSN